MHKYSKSHADTGNLIKYNDRNEISNWANDAMHWGISTGIIKGRSTDMICPKDTILTYEAEIMMKRFNELPDITLIKETLQELTNSSRYIGSAGEKNAVKYLTDRFEKMGYSVTLQEYNASENISGNNVIAIHKATLNANPDILVISTHHACVSTSFGANDNASGVAALLQVAEQIKNIETDTEIRFISFTDEENGKIS